MPDTAPDPTPDPAPDNAPEHREPDPEPKDDRLRNAITRPSRRQAVVAVLLAVLGWLQLGDVVPTPDAGDIPVPTLLLAGGAVAGLVLALVARWINGAGAARRARAAQRRLESAVETVADELVVAPVQAELATRRDLCATLARAAS